MPFQHKTLAAGRWQTLSLTEQMANIGSEIERALSWRAKGDKETSQAAFFRALELLDLSLADPRHQGRRKELSRVRENLVDFFAGDNTSRTTPEKLSAYFFAFTYAARNKTS